MNDGLGELVSRRIAVDEINAGFEAMRRGEVAQRDRVCVGGCTAREGVMVSEAKHLGATEARLQGAEMLRERSA